MPLTFTENTSIDYDVHGEGPPLILIGGLGFGRWGWFKQVPALSRHFQTITFDSRGERGLENGVADLTADVVALLDHLGVGKAHVLGTSLGGFVAQELALVRPDLVDRLILVCTSYGGRGPEAMSTRALADMMGWGTFSAEEAVRRGLQTATSDTYRAEHPDEFEQIVRWRLADSPSAAAHHAQTKAGARFDLSDDVEHITSPTLVIHGAEDRYVPARQRRRPRRGHPRRQTTRARPRRPPRLYRAVRGGEQGGRLLPQQAEAAGDAEATGVGDGSPEGPPGARGPARGRSTAG